MTRLTLPFETEAEKTVNDMYGIMSNRLANCPQGNCPLELLSAFIKLCLAQSCGKCVPCRIGLKRLSEIIDNIVSGEGNLSDLDLIKTTAETIYSTSDCAIGFETAKFVLESFDTLHNEYISHIENNKCTENFESVPCVAKCPANVDIPGYISLVGEKRYSDAVRLIRNNNPFPSACALICEHPCEKHCRRGIVDSPINIRGLKLMAIENAGNVPAPKCLEPTGKKIAVIGGGPSGLSAAYYLSLMGHSVTVFEKNKKLGGMLRYGIPPYRLPDKYLDNDINCILSTGITVKYGVNIGKDYTISNLRNEYDALYISIGAQSGTRLGIEGEDLNGTLSAVDFLKMIGSGNFPDFSGKKVVVIGGGNVAMDAVRTSKRLGADSVKCVYRRRISDMTALEDEIRSAMAEGCEIEELKSPVRIMENNGKICGLCVKPQIIGDVKNKRPSPYDSDLPEEIIPADIVITAIGQKIDSSDFENDGIKTNKGRIISDITTAVPGLDGIFAGGDSSTGPATVIKAIAAGKTAAANIDEYLGFRHEISEDIDIPKAKPYFKSECGRIEIKERSVFERNNDFDLTEICMTEKEASQECLRCLRCDFFGHGGFAGGRCGKW